MKIFFTLLLVLLFLLPADVQAHTLETDGSIGAILHVDPNDEPIANSQATFLFEFKDKTNKFRAEDCDCTFEVVQNGKKIYSAPLFKTDNKPNVFSASAAYTFPKRDIYTVAVIGKSRNNNSFTPFALSWDFRIDQDASPSSGEKKTAKSFISPAVLGGSILLICIAVYFMVRKRSLKKEIKRGGDHHEKHYHKRY